MADEFDVASALVAIASGAVYLNGIGAASISNSSVIIYPGWPNPQTLDTDLAAGKTHVSVYPLAGDTTSSVMMGEGEWDELGGDTVEREVMRVSKLFQVSIWAPTPTLRSTIGKAVMLALSLTTRISLAGGETAMLTYTRTRDDDSQQKALIYRRDLFFTGNFPITQTAPATVIQHTFTNVTGNSGPTISLTTPRT